MSDGKNGLQLRSLIKKSGELELSLLDVPPPDPAADEVVVRVAADACEAETYEYVAESYARITRALAEDDRWWFAGEESKWLSRAADVRAGRRPSRGTPRADRAPPRSGAAGCTWRRDRCEPARRS